MASGKFLFNSQNRMHISAKNPHLWWGKSPHRCIYSTTNNYERIPIKTILTPIDYRNQFVSQLITFLS